MIEQWMSDELRDLSPHLTGQQWAGVIKIVKAELAGRSLTALLISPDRPCATSTYYGRWNRMGSALEQMQYYHEQSVIRHWSDPAQADIGLGGEIVVGRFVEIDKPTFSDLLRGASQ